MEVTIVSLWWKVFKRDFYFFIFTTVLCLETGLANGLLMSILLSLLIILKISSKPIWNIKDFKKIKNEYQRKINEDK